MTRPNVLVLAAVVAGGFDGAEAVDVIPSIYHSHGSACQPIQEAASSISYGEPGVVNLSATSDARVFCPFGLVDAFHLETHGAAVGFPLPPRLADAPPFLVSEAELDYIDSSRTELFWCYMWSVDPQGGQWWTARQYTCINGGCPDEAREFIGTKAMFWSSPFPTWLRNSAVGVSCNVPPTTPDGASWVIGYSMRVDTESQ